MESEISEKSQNVENPQNLDLGGNLSIHRNGQGQSLESDPNVIGNVNEVQPEGEYTRLHQLEATKAKNR